MLYSILRTYKYDNGIVVLKKESIDIDCLIKTCLNEVNSLAEEKFIKFYYKNNSSNKLFADYEQLRRVVGNLVNNAINYSYNNSNININNYQNIKNDNNILNNNNNIFNGNKIGYNEIVIFKKYLNDLSKDEINNLPIEIKNELKDIFNILYQKLTN